MGGIYQVLLFMIMLFLISIFALIVLRMMRQRMKEKESELLELYEAIEELMKELEGMAQQHKSEMESIRTALYHDFNEVSEQIKQIKSQKEVLVVKPLPSVEKKIASKTLDGQEQNRFSIEKRTKIENLRKQGLSIAEIAKEMKLGQGEISLVLGIPKRNLSVF